MYIVN